MRLLTRPQKLSREEFGDRWAASQEKFYRLAYCYVKNEHDAKEILAEATYRGFCAMDSLREPRYFDTWMSRILIRCAYDFLKQQKRFVPFDDTMEQESADERQLSDLRVDLYRLMDALPTEDRSLLILKFFEERTFEEISEITEMPVNTVKTRVYRSLARLRNLQEGGARQ